MSKSPTDEASAAARATDGAPLGARIAAIVDARSPRAYVIAFAFAIVVSALAIIVIEAAGAVRMSQYAHDQFLLLDGGWRVMQGQHPHTDFYCPLGAFPALLVAFGLWIGGHHVASLIHGSVLLAIVLGGWTLALARTRLSAMLAAAAALIVVFTLLGTHPLGFDVDESSYAMLYNRHAFAILAIVWLELSTSPTKPGDATASARTIAFGGASTGALIALLFFLKLNYFGLAVASAGWRVLSQPGRKPWMTGSLAGFAAMSLPFLVYLRFDVGAMLHDFIVVTRARSETLSVDRCIQVFGDNGVWIAAVVVLGGVTMLIAPKKWNDDETAAVLAETLLLIGVGVMLIATNWQASEAPIFAVGALPLLQRAARWLATTPERERGRIADRYVIATTFAAFLVLRTIGHDVLGIVHTTTERAHDEEPAHERFSNNAALADFIVHDGGGSCPGDYAAKVRDGLALLDGVTNDSTRLFVADFTNPFNFALKLRSPRGDAMWWHYGFTYNRRSPLSPDVVLRDVNLALVPRNCPEDLLTNVDMTTWHIAWLNEHFVERASSKYWLLLERK
jgi:hypothetical protein